MRGIVFGMPNPEFRRRRHIAKPIKITKVAICSFKLKEKFIMDTRFLDSFLQVAQLGSAAAAARKLNLTPTAVAQRIRSLEDEIGQPLLIRTGRTLQLTPAGSALLGPARELLVRSRELKAIAALDTVAGDLRIGCITTALSYLVPGVLDTLIKNYEHLHPHVEPAFSTELHRMVLTDRIDIAMMVEPQFELPKEYVWKALVNEPFVVLAPLEMAGEDPHELLRTQPFIRYHRRSFGGMLADRYLMDAGIQPMERFEIDALDAIAAMVKGRLGVSLVPQWRPLHAQLDLMAQIPLPAPGLHRSLGLLWKRNSAKERLVEVFCKVLFEQNQL